MSVEIPLTQGKVAIISDEDADLAEQCWSYQRRIYGEKIYHYATRFINASNKINCTLLHRVILGRMLGRPPAKNEMVEHIDGNTLNNQRGNLRYCTKEQRMQRHAQQKNNTSGYRGVYFNKKERLWRAQLTKSNHYLGSYPSAEEAARVYDKAVLELYGEQAKLNFPQERMKAK